MGKRTNVNVSFRTLQDPPPSTSQGSYLSVLAPRCTLIELVLKLYTDEGRIVDRMSIDSDSHVPSQTSTRIHKLGRREREAINYLQLVASQMLELIIFEMPANIIVRNTSSYSFWSASNYIWSKCQ